MPIALPQNLIDELQFGPWLSWTRRTQSQGAELPGVYLLAHFDAVQSGRVDPTAREVIYIGQTARGSLKRRWSKFEKSATTGEFAHSGGRNYHETFLQSDLRRLYASPLPVNDMLGRELKAYLLFVERSLIWTYFTRWAELPACNKE